MSNRQRKLMFQRDEEEAQEALHRKDYGTFVSIASKYHLQPCDCPYCTRGEVYIPDFVLQEQTA